MPAVAVRWAGEWVAHDAERCPDCGHYILPRDVPGRLLTGSEARRRGVRLLREQEVCRCQEGNR